MEIKYTKCTKCSYVYNKELGKCPKCNEPIKITEDKNNNELLFNILD